MGRQTKDRVKVNVNYVILIAALLAIVKCDKNPILIEKTYCTFFVDEEDEKITLDHCKLYDGKSQFTTWESCSRKCCQANLIDHYPTISYPALSACNPNQSDNYKDTIFLVGKICIIVSLTILSIIVLSIIRHQVLQCKKVNILCHSQSSKLQELQKQDQLTTKMNDIKWMKQDHVEDRLMDGNNCSICLEEDCNTLLSCQHQYHSECIAAWLDKKRSCPLCQKNRIGILKVYCKYCIRQYFTCEYNLVLKQQWQSAKKKCKSCEDRQDLSRQQFIHQIILSKTSLCEHH